MHEEFIGTMPVQEQAPLRRRAVWTRYHAARMWRAFAGPLQVEQFKGGQSNPTFLLTTPGQALRAAAQAAGQAAALGPCGGPRVSRHLGAASSAESRWRAAWALCEDDIVIGTAFYIMDYVEGRVLWDQALPGMTPRASAPPSTTR